jgi:hypothetical protein
MHTPSAIVLLAERCDRRDHEIATQWRQRLVVKAQRPRNGGMLVFHENVCPTQH